LEHPDRPSEELAEQGRKADRALVANAAACVAWVLTLLSDKRSWGMGPGVVPMALVVLGVIVAALYVHMTGVAFGISLARRQELRPKAWPLLLTAGAPLLGLLGILGWVFFDSLP
jgi:hypothetical protein